MGKHTNDKALQAISAESQAKPPSISLPKGGGAIRGMGEKFAVNPVTGTGTMRVPIATSPGRSGFGPQVTIAYDSGTGNGPFGFGWHLSLPAITRKTDKGLPRYWDAEDSDVFLLSGAEDLVPVYRQDHDGSWVASHTGYQRYPGESWVRDQAGRLVIHEDERDGYRVRRYRPRIEGLFARIERWTHHSSAEDTFWRSISKENVTTWYGRRPQNRIADPADPKHVFSWLICQSYDDKGNAIVYEYKSETSDNIDLTQVNEKNRTTKSRQANRYLKRILYGNRKPNRDPDTWQAFDPSQLPVDTWMFEAVFDYGEHDANAPAPNIETALWPCRNDPFSSYRSGFEVRTYRLCQRVLMFHHFDAEGDVGRDCLVRSTDFTYSYEEDPLSVQNPIFSYLLSVTQSGFRRTQDGYMKKSLPPLELAYSPVPGPERLAQLPVRQLDAESLENLPAGLDGKRNRWVDLDGDGMSGILSEEGDGWYYKRNLSANRFTGEPGKERTTAGLGPIEAVAPKPAMALAGGAQFLDLAGDGQMDLAQMEGEVRGFYERSTDTGWMPFRPFASWPEIHTRDPDLRFVDLTGDGHADILITEGERLTWCPSIGEAGFGPALRVCLPSDEEKGPRLIFADAGQSVYLTDLSGDGLNDFVRIQNGEICYWPNLGYGRFGPKVTMDNSPWLDAPDQFDHRRIRLADIDGSGTTDIVYMHRDGARAYFNQSGNSWSDAAVLPQFPAIDNITSVQVLDLLGNGTACLVWSSPLPDDARRPMQYLALMEEKPHLMTGVKNNLGAETKVHYASSTKFYLDDKRAGKPWMTRLPFPVHVVERVETYDWIGGNRFITRSAYHHGHFDGEEREFRGFGMVEQWDTEELVALEENGGFPEAVNIDAASYVPPVLTRTWFHTGAYAGGRRISRGFEKEYNREGTPGLSNAELETQLLPDTILPSALKQLDGRSIPCNPTAREAREACRALKGAVLRREIYALDGTEARDLPYSAKEQNYTIELLQPCGSNPHAVFFAHPRESLDYRYERKQVQVGGKQVADPRVTHSMTLQVDGYGNVLQSATIGYGRRKGLSPLQGKDRNKQEQPLVTYTETSVTNAVESVDDHRPPLPCETRTFEVTGLRKATDDNRFSFDEILADCAAAAPIDYEKTATTGQTEKRLIEHLRSRYRKNDLTGFSPLGVLASMAIPGKTYKMAYTSGLAKQIYVNSGKSSQANLDAMLAGEAKYVHSEGDDNWWIPSSEVFLSPHTDDTAAQELAFARQHFFLPHRFRDPFHTPAVGTESIVGYDAYSLLLIETRDALGNTVGAVNDYRALAPKLMTNPNGNRSAVAYDALGLVAGTALMGKANEGLGDLLESTFEPDPTQAQLNAFMTSPRQASATPGQSEATQIVHDLLAKATTRIVYDIDRFRRLGEPAFAATLARETHLSDLPQDQKSRIMVSFSYSDGFGREIQKKVQAEPGPALDGGPVVNPRWVGSGWTIFNNKGNPVRQYEPFFDDTNGFRFGKQTGVSRILFYDPVQRVVATLHPNHTFEKRVIEPWRQITYDTNDTVTFDPKTDAEVGRFFSRLPDSAYLPTWYTHRINGTAGAEEKSAAEKAAAHADTPAIIHSDALGRPFLSVADNGAEGHYETRTELDIEGNRRAVTDTLGRIVMTYDYDMLGTRIHQFSMETGERWMLHDISGKPLYVWDSRNHRFRTAYDPLRRPIESHVREGAGPESLVGRTVYGETQQNPEHHNLRGNVFSQYDQAGAVTTDAYDFKGNPLLNRAQLLQDYKNQIDWNQSPPLESETFTSHRRYDALNRVIRLTTPDLSEAKPTFNEANMLEKLAVRLRGASTWTPFVNDIDYDAKGQRVSIDYANGISTRYAYDKDTFRLMHLKTTRASDGDLQNLAFTYDPVGNITAIADTAQQTIYFNGQVAKPHGDYTYDAVYRLIQAKGREHIGQALQPESTWNDAFRAGLQHPHNGQAMRNYTEQYHYNDIGNFDKLMHQADNGNWTREYAYTEPSMIEPGTKHNNRLSSTTVGSNNPVTEKFVHDFHGNMVRMPHLAGAHPDANMHWDFQDQLHQTDLAGGGTGFYTYDATGRRVRKVWEKSANLIEERIYFGGFEIFRRRSGGGTVSLERESLYIMDGQQQIALAETKTIDGASPIPNPQPLIRYQFGNHLGSASLELDAAGAIISYEEYYPYGSTSYQAGRNASEVSLKRYRYTGKERDAETGFYYHGARYYAPWLGRWTAADPIGIEDGLNLYAYVSGNPIGFIDREGTQGLNLSTEGKYPHRVTYQTMEEYQASPAGSDYTVNADGTISATVWKDYPEATITPQKPAPRPSKSKPKKQSKPSPTTKPEKQPSKSSTSDLLHLMIMLHESQYRYPETYYQITGTFRAGTAAVGLLGAAAFSGESGGLGLAPAAFIASVSLDEFLTGVRQIYSGTPTFTYRYELGSGIATMAGADPEWSNVAGISADMFTNAGAGYFALRTNPINIVEPPPYQVYFYHGTVKGREVVTVSTPSGLKAFYLRTGGGGTNVGGAQPGDWAPFEGFTPRGGIAVYKDEVFQVGEGWMVKHRFVYGLKESDPLYRWGTPQNAEAAGWLKTQEIPVGGEVKTHVEVQSELQFFGVATENPLY